jgi:hypothetical protein
VRFNQVRLDEPVQNKRRAFIYPAITAPQPPPPPAGLTGYYSLEIDVEFGAGALVKATNAFTIFIDGVDRTLLALANSLNITQPLSQAATANFSMWDPSGTVPPPQVGQEVQIYHGTTRIFGGIVTQPVQTAYQANEGALYAGSGGTSSSANSTGVSSATGSTSGGVQCSDYSYRLSRRYVGAYYTSPAFLSDIVADIVNTYLAADGFTYDDSDGDPGIDLGPILFNWVTVQAAFNTLSSSTGWEFTVDYYKVIRFYPPGSGTGPAPFDIADNDGNIYAESLAIEYFITQYRNRQGIMSPTSSTQLWQDTFSVDVPGPFPLEPQPPDGIRRAFLTLYDINATPVVEVNGVPQNVISLLDVASNPPGWQWYWIPPQGFPEGGPGVFQNPANPALQPGDVLTVNYATALSPIYWVQDDAQIAARQAIEGGSGIYEDVEQAPSTTDPNAIAIYAQWLLNRYGANGIPYQVSYGTRQPGLFAGMLQSINTSNPPIAINSDSGLIIQVTIADVDGQFLTYTATVANKLYQGNWTQFFAALIAAAALPQPGVYVSYTWDIGQSVPGVANPGAGTGTQPGSRVVQNPVELLQSITVNMVNPVAGGIVEFQVLLNGSGLYIPVDYAAGQTGVQQVFIPFGTPGRLYAGDILQIFIGGTDGVTDASVTVQTAIAVS